MLTFSKAIRFATGEAENRKPVYVELMAHTYRVVDGKMGGNRNHLISLALVQDLALKSFEGPQQDKLNAVKARLLYGDESRRNSRNHEESHYSESKTPTARTEPRRKHGSKHSQSPSPIASVFIRLRRNRPPSPRPRPYKEGGVFNRLGGKNKVHPHVLTAFTVPTRREPKCNQGSIITWAHRLEETADIRRVKTVREVTGNPNQRGTGQTPTKMISLSLGRVRKETLSHLGSDISISQGQGCLAMSRHTTEAGIRKTT
ncbi:hypothetical protein Tco_0545796 [Tanacetum coccineum]